MPSFDVVSRIDLQEVDNAVNNTRREVATRYDFRNTVTVIDFDRKEKKLKITAADEMKMEAVREMLLNHAGKRKIDLKAFKFGDVQPGAQTNVKCEVTLRDGIEQEMAKKIVKTIKDAKLKVQASIQGDELRVSGKKIDDLQAVIALLRAPGSGADVPLQFINMKS